MASTGNRLEQDLRQLELTDEERDDAPASTHPTEVHAMAATLSREVFSDPQWIFERKLDGVRCLAHRNGDSVHLWSRNHRDLGVRFPEVVEALRRQPCEDFVVDGEVVAFVGDQTSFSALQQGARPVFFYVFDMVHADGRDLRRLPLRRRKELLEGLIEPVDPIRRTLHIDGDGEEAYADACESGWEGIIAKDARSRYEGKRSKAWLKLKCESGQELVIGGWTDPQGAREHLGALLVGYHEGDRLRYAGKVGTGFGREALQQLAGLLSARERDATPFDDRGLPRKGVHWIEPDLVCQVAFTEWTADGRLRHPRFLGLRDDKAAADVVRERPG